MKKATYQVRKAGGELLPVVAWEFDLLGIGPLIVTRDPDNPKMWSIAEPQTGAFFTRNHQTRKGAINAATEMVHIDGTITREIHDRAVTDYLKNRYPDVPTEYYKQLQAESLLAETSFKEQD